jgi:prevent-host-death family protein
MTTIINVAEAKAKLSELIARVEAGEEFTIARAGKPTALVHGQIVVTRNVRDFRPFGVKTLDPFKTI